MTYCLDGQQRTLMAWIPARAGSKGVPRKALQHVGECSLLAHTIRAALRVPGMDRVAVTTDDPEMRELALAEGAEAPFLRPVDLAQDDSSLSDVFLHVYRWYQQEEGFVPDIHMGMSPTHPLRRCGTLTGALEHLGQNPRIYNLRSVTHGGHLIDELWQCEGDEARRYLVPREGVARERIHRDLFAFNIVADCRGPNADPAPHPFIIDPLEAIDVDEPKDLELARLVMRSASWQDGSGVVSWPEFTGWRAPECSVEERAAHWTGEIAGKRFPVEQLVSSSDRLLHHADYPLIEEGDVLAFLDWARRADRIGITACQAKTHPYRLLREEADGQLAPLVDIPQSIRGFRQRYPRYLQRVPALVWVPRDTRLDAFASLPRVRLFELPAEKLLDVRSPLDRLLIAALREEPAKQDSNRAARGQPGVLRTPRVQS